MDNFNTDIWKRHVSLKRGNDGGVEEYINSSKNKRQKGDNNVCIVLKE